jgi:protein gp37
MGWAMSKIEWTDVSWNPVRGCSRVSEGCRHCYAERQAMRFRGSGKPFENVVDEYGWTGKVELIEHKLEEPLHWRKPRRIFVNSMSDLFHEALSFDDISRVYGVMQQANWHTYQILTKRERRLYEFTAWLRWQPWALRSSLLFLSL